MSGASQISEFVLGRMSWQAAQVSPVALVLLILAVVVVGVDWWAVGTERRSVEVVAKPLTMALLVALAALAGHAEPTVRWLVVLGALFGLLGDTALLGEGTSWFLRGLAAFAVGHILYTAAAIVVGIGTIAWIGVAITVVLFGYRFTSRTVPGACRQGGVVMMSAVILYAAVIGAMVIASVGTGLWLAAIGAVLFAVSDWVLGHRQFVDPTSFDRLAVMVPYHTGQALLILGLVLAG